MKWAIAILLCLSVLPVAAQAPPSVEARWLSPTTAEVVWSGPGGPGVCLVRAGPPALTFSETCGEPSGVVALGPGGDYLRAPKEGARFVLWDGTKELSSATLPEPPRYVMIFPSVVAP